MAPYSSYYLEIQDGADRGQRFLLQGNTIMIGREIPGEKTHEGVERTSQQLLFKEHTLSRLHALLQWDDKERTYRVINKSQTGRTMVNAVPASNIVLKDGDSLALGDLICRYVEKPAELIDSPRIASPQGSKEIKPSPSTPGPQKRLPPGAQATSKAREASQQKNGAPSPLHRPSLEELAVLARQLATLIQAGITFVEAVRIVMASQEPRSRLKPVLEEFYRLLQGGVRPERAITQFTGIFSPHFTSLLAMGMESGRIADAMNTLGNDLEKEHGLQKRITAALTYPLFVFVLTILLNGVLFVCIFPKIISMLKELHVAMPLITKGMMVIAGFLANPWCLALTILAAAGFALQARYFISTPVGRFYYDKIKLHVPIFGGINRTLFAERFTRTMSTLFKYGFTLQEALRITEKVCANDFLNDSFFSVIERQVEEGESFDEALRNQPVIPRAVPLLVAVGMESGDLSSPLRQASEMYELEIYSVLQKVVTLIEPCMIMFMSSVILVTILSVMLPLYSVIARLGQ